MTRQDDFDRMLAGWLEADALTPAPTGRLDRALDATRRRRPRPAWLAGLGSHWVGETPDGRSILSGRLLPLLGLRPLTALILLAVIMALLGGAVLVGARLLTPGPLPLGDLGQLAYDLDNDIYLADWDGSDPVRITDVPSGDEAGCDVAGFGDPIWSPDGRYFAYRYNAVRCPSDSIGMVTISDPNGHVLASFPGYGWAIAWSPDSTRVATWIDSDTDAIGVHGLDGTREALLTLPAGYGVHRDDDAHWSPDGGSLLISLRPDPGGDPRQTWELPLDGRTPQPVPADDPRSHWDASWSADGAHVAYIDGGFLAGDPAGTQSLIVAAADGSQAPVVASREFSPSSPRACDYCPPDGMMSDPVLSPTGDLIAFSVLAGQIPDVAGFSDLRLVDVATRAVTSLADGRDTDGLDAITFSPEGDRILFSRTDVNYEGSLWSVQADGSGVQLLVAGTNEGDWQPLAAGS